jgi:DNA repair protein RecN (Recombination protein N)
MEELARYDARFVEPVQQLQAAKAAVEDVSAVARDFAEKVQAGPERLADIEDRLAELDRLKRKYGRTLAEVIAFGVESARQLKEVENRDAILEQLRAEEAAQAQSYRVAAEALTQGRAAAAKVLEKAAEQQINGLAMRVKFQVGVASSHGQERWAAHGWDEVDYRIATNAGEPLKPLEEIASGGEMSRVMLALKVTVEEAATSGARGRRKQQALPRTLVFDEIDIGIGGRAAEAVGQRLKALSQTQQVLCITHLPQIAAFADQHFLIEKTESRGRTHTGIRRMEQEERVREIARMLSGATLTETSLRHAENLISATRQTVLS